MTPFCCHKDHIILNRRYIQVRVLTHCDSLQCVKRDSDLYYPTFTMHHFHATVSLHTLQNVEVCNQS